MDKELLLSRLVKKIEDCKRCNLWKGATQAVPGEGDSDAKVVFVGEGPGFHEDRLGQPFVGQAGKLLDKLLSSIQISRSQVFIGNLVKHRPPENRDPAPSEIAACKVWLDQQLEIINPKIVVTLGRHSLAKFLPTSKISQVHGKALRVNRQVVIPMYHPAAALRSRDVLVNLEEDFRKNAEILRDPDKISEVEELKDSNKDPNQMGFFNK